MGDKSTMIIFGFALATGFVSMFMSNVTATAMMLPIGVAMIKQLGLTADSGFAKALGLSIPFAASIGGMGTIAIIFVIAILVSVITEACSNFVVASAFLPAIYGIALQLGIEPMLLIMTVTLSASFAYMMPTGTPTNAIAFGSGFIDIKDMIKGGFAVKVLSIALFPIVMYFIAAPLTSLF